MAMLVSYQVSPCGFQSPLYDGIKSGIEADALVVEAYHKVRLSISSECNTWQFRRKIINRALDLFGYLRDWLEANEKNPRMTIHMRALLEDTLQYISTGRRPMALTSRWECIRYERSDGASKFRPGRHTPKLISLLHVPVEDYMWHWLKHPDGFTDMVCTLNIIFGQFDGDAKAVN
jgi:hypothetical protein